MLDCTVQGEQLGRQLYFPRVIDNTRRVRLDHAEPQGAPLFFHVWFPIQGRADPKAFTAWRQSASITTKGKKRRAYC